MSGPATVITKHLDGYGTVLATASGQALYLLTSDPHDGSRCTGSCTVRWHPLVDAATPKAGPGVQQGLLSTFRRSDGSLQVSYDGHPLYTYSGAGEGAGAGLESDGGVWYLVAPSGKAIERTMSGGY